MNQAYGEYFSLSKYKLAKVRHFSFERGRRWRIGRAMNGSRTQVIWLPGSRLCCMLEAGGDAGQVVRLLLRRNALIQ